MALKDQTKRAKPLECRNDVIGLIKGMELGKISLLFISLGNPNKKGGSCLPPF
jgi:hypothetical protein